MNKNRILHWITAGSVIFSSLGPGWAPQAHAALTAANMFPMVAENESLGASAVRPLVGFNLASNNTDADKLIMANLSIRGGNGFQISRDLSTMTTGSSTDGGLNIYKDNKATGQLGRFDAADTRVTLVSAPTLYESRFSKLTPATSTLDNGATAGGTLSVTAGDLVFAKVGSGQYGWHLATGSGNLSSDSGEITAVLDGTGTSTSAVSASSRMSRITPSIAPVQANGVGASGTSTVAQGDLIYTKRASESNYAWHIVSGAGTTLSDDATENNAALDGYAADPAVAADSWMTRIRPSASVVATGTSTLEVVAGDLVYLELLDYGYGWHVVTGAGGLSNSGGENTAIIDYPRRSPNIVAGSVMSKITPGSGDLTLMADDTTTNTAMEVTAGDIAYALTGEFPFSPNPAYGWYMATADGSAVSGGVASSALRLNGEQGQPGWMWQVMLQVATPQDIPGSDNPPGEPDYFIVAKTAATPTSGGMFSTYLQNGTDLVTVAGSPAQGMPFAPRVRLDITPFSVNAGQSWPQDSQPNVPVDLRPHITFNKDPNPSTVASENVILRRVGGEGNLCTSFQPVPQGFDCLPTNPLDPNTQYTLTVTTSVRDIGGTALASNYLVTFTTSSGSSDGGGIMAPPPVVISTTPPRGATIFRNSSVSAIFSQDMVASNSAGQIANSVISASNVFLTTEIQGGGTGQNVEGTLTYDQALKTVKFTPAAALTAGQSYLFIVKNTVKSRAGQFLGGGNAPDSVVRFTAGSTSDTTAPTVQLSMPANGSSNISVTTSEIGIGFSEAMDQSTISASTANLKKSAFTHGAASAGGNIYSDTLSLALGDLVFYKPSSGSYGWGIVTSANATSTNPGVNGAAAAAVAASSIVVKMTPAATGTTTGANPAVSSIGLTAGDVVFYPTDGSATSYQWGIITASSSAVAAYTVNGSQVNASGSGANAGRIARMSPAETGSVTASTQLFPGDIVFAYTTNNPATSGYGWHVVTTGAAVNSSNLRLDGSSSAPTFSSGTRFARFIPAHSSPVTTLEHTLQAGDIVFGYTSASPTTTGYGWHVVTTADTKPGGDSLRLDGFTTKPTYALSTVLANFRTVTGSIGYVPEYNGAQFSPRFPLALNTSYTLTVIGGSSGVRDLAGNALATSYTSSFTTASTFTVANPRVVRSFTDTTAISIEFSEQMKKESGPNGAENVGNFSLESPVGTPVSLNGKTISYDPLKKQSRISGLALTAGATYKVTVNSAAQSLFGAAMDTSGTPAQNTHQGTVISAGLTGGQAGTVIVQDRATTGMMPNIAFPRVKLAGATTAYELKFKVSTAVPAGSTIRVKFPLGTNLAAVALATPGSESFFNSDMNGPGTGTVILSTGAETSGGANNDGVTLDANDSRIAILTLGAVGISANDYVQIDLKGVVNTTLAADRNTSSGHTINIETLNTSRDTLDSITTEAFFLGEQGARVISGRVLRADGVTGLNGARIGVFSHLLGAGQMVTTANNAAGGGQDGEYLVSGISDGEYNLGVDPSSPAIVATNEQPPSFHEPIIIAGSDVLNRNFALSSAPRTITINITGGPANKSVDVFANGQNCSAMRTISLDGSGAASTSLRVQNNVTCSVGMGPALPKDPNFRGGITQFDFMPPPFQTVVIATSNPDAITFALSTTNRTISGTVVDGSGTGIPNVELWARPISTGAGGGSPGKTGSDGSFTINVVDGTYIIAAGFPGLPFIESTPVTVNATGQSPLAASVVIKLAKTSLTISGNVTDADGNGIPYAEIWAEEITSITDERPRGGRPPVPSKADSQGAYTVYVNAGVWKVHAGTSGYGYLGNQITTVSDSSVTLRNFSPSLNGTQYALSGRIMQNSTNVAGAKIFARATSGMGGNRTDSDSTTGESNNYSLKLYDGTYDIGGMLPDGSELPFTRVTINGANATQNIDVGAAITVTVNVTTGAAAITDAFVDVRNAQGFGQGTSKNSRSGVNGVYIIKVPAGSTYTVRASRNGIPIGTEITGVTTTSTQTVTAGTSYTVSGTVTSGATNIEGAWVALVGTPTGRSNPINIGGITLSNGTYSISGIPAGTYKVSANKPGYMDATPSTVTVTNASIENQNRSLTTAARTISGTISRSDGGAASSGFVEAINTSTSEVVVDDIDTNGAYTVSVNAGTWRVKARLDGYVSSEATVTVTSDANATQNITAAPITGYTVRSPYKVSYTANQGGIHTDPNIGANFRLSMPANALGTTADSASLSSKLTTSVPSTSSAQPLGGKGITLSATNSSGRPITSLNDKATISIPYDEADLPAGKTENDLIIGYFDITANDWKPVECVQDKTNDVFTCTTNHFSDFAPLVTSTSVPTPTGLGATASAATTVSLSWTVASGATSYNIYRSTSANGTFARLGSEPTVSSGSTTTYSDTSVSASTAYYYKISSKDATGESSASDAVSVTTPAAAASSNSGSSGSSGSSSSTGGGPLPVSTPSVQPSTPSTSTTPATPAQPATPTVSPAVPAVPASPALENRVRQIERITSESKVLTHGAPQEVAAAVGKTRDEKQEARIEKNIVSRVVPRTATESIRETVTSFVTYGTMETESLGAGERAGVVDSYKSIYGKLPTSETDWQDVMKIAVGRFPSQRNEKAEKYNAEKMFERIYKRTADRTNAHDDAAVVVMTYGLRPADRNLQSEAAAIKSYKAIFGAAPSSAYDWDVVRAIAYSGAKR